MFLSSQRAHIINSYKDDIFKAFYYYVFIDFEVGWRSVLKNVSFTKVNEVFSLQ